MKIKAQLLLKSFLLSFLLFALISSIIIANAYMEKVSLKPLEKESNILIGVVHDNQLISIAVLNFNPQKGEIAFLPIPDNTLISDNTVLQDLYKANNAKNLISKVENLVGANIQRHLILSTDAIREITNQVGKVNFYIPYKFVHNDTEFSGQSNLSGDTAYSMFAYTGYNMKEVSISDMASSFLQSFLSNHANSSSIGKIKTALCSANVLKATITNLTNEEISAYCDYISDYSSLSHRFLQIKGTTQSTSKSKYFTPDELIATKNIFK